MSFDLFRAVTDLRTGWGTLHDLDRTEKIAPILGAGMSIRTLAKAVGTSEALIRHLLKANNASPGQKARARAGQLSTRELVRGVERRMAAEQVRQRQMTEAQHASAAEAAAKIIVRWLRSEFSPPLAEQVAHNAHFLLDQAEANGTLPRDRAPAGMDVQEIIERCRPREEGNCDDQLWLAADIRWLALWVFYAYPDPTVRDRAMQLACSEVARG